MFILIVILSSASSYAGNCTSFVSLSHNFSESLISSPIDLTVAMKAMKLNIESKKICPKCSKTLCNGYSLERHLRNVCGKSRNSNGKFQCERCNIRNYQSRGSLTRHQKFECRVPARFKCFFCLKLFHQKTVLERHIKKYCKNVIQQTRWCFYVQLPANKNALFVTEKSSLLHIMNIEIGLFVDLLDGNSNLVIKWITIRTESGGRFTRCSDVGTFILAKKFVDRLEKRKTTDLQ